MKLPTATHISYLHLCHRKLWLFHHGIRMEQSSERVEEGRFVHETTYGRRSGRSREIAVGPVKIDHYDKRTGTIHETKLSASREYAHIAQLRYYMEVLKRAGFNVRRGILEYPKLREREEILPEQEDAERVDKWVQEVAEITAGDACPDLVRKSLCRHCAYRDFCFVEE